MSHTNTSGGPSANVCITVGTDGTDSGLKHGAFGASNPTHTTFGPLFHSMLWKSDGSSDLVQFKFGDNGDSELAPGLDTILLHVPGGNTLVGTWIPATKTYDTNDQALVDMLNKVTIGDDICGYLEALPDLLVHYDFADVNRGDLGC